MKNKGKKNVYTCQTCNKAIVTIDADNGTTPFMISCKVTLQCKGDMHSHWYTPDAQALEATWEWFKPKKLPRNKYEREHVQKGGLLLRPVLSHSLTQAIFKESK